MKRSGATYLLFLLMFVGNAIAQLPPEDNEDADAPAPEAFTSEPTFDLGEGSTFSLTKRPATRGLYLGKIWNIHPEKIAITVRPETPNSPRKRFYLDTKTRFISERKPTNFAALALGHKVAIRYFSEKGVAVADTIFLVDGEFKKEDYLPKPKAAPKAKE